MSEKLKPCPFCGKDEANFTTDKWGNYYVECEYCGAQTNPYDDKEIVIEEWQTRPIEDELRKRIAELERFKMIVEGCGFEVITEPPVLNRPERKILKGHGTIYVPESPEPQECK